MKRIQILTGHYGSGKSEIAINLALEQNVNMLVDLDIVNPYFRSRSMHELLEKNGVSLVESTIEKSLGSDLPFISPKGSRPFYDPNITAIYDLAGTHAGAKLLMQYHKYIDPKDIDFLVVINIFRMETATKKQIIDVIKTLETFAQVKVTGLINNSNLMQETTSAHIEAGEAVVKSVSEALNLPIRYTFIEESIETNRTFEGQNKRLTRYLAKKWL